MNLQGFEVGLLKPCKFIALIKIEHRQVIAATNFLSFGGVFLASLLLYLIAAVFGLEADKGFTVVGTVTLAVSIAIFFQFFDYLSRFVAMILSKLHFRTTFLGMENIPKTPAIYLCTHTAWNDMLLMLGAQRRRMRFFVEREQDHHRWVKRLYKMLRIVNIPSIEPLENNQACLFEIKSSLKKGISVCVFLDNQDICSEFSKLLKSYSFQEVIQEMHVPVIPVNIEKGSKEKESRWFKRLMDHMHVPASIAFGPLVCDIED